MCTLIFLLWTLNVSLHVQLFWDVLFSAPLVLSLTWKGELLNSNFLLKRECNTSLERILSYLMSLLHGQVILLESITLDLLALCLAQRHKRKRLLGGNPICFLLYSLVVLICYYCSNIIVYLFLSFLPSYSLRLQESSKVVTCCPETDYVCLTEKFTKNHQIIFWS